MPLGAVIPSHEIRHRPDRLPKYLVSTLCSIVAVVVDAVRDHGKKELECVSRAGVVARAEGQALSLLITSAARAGAAA